MAGAEGQSRGDEGAEVRAGERLLGGMKYGCNLCFGLGLDGLEHVAWLLLFELSKRGRMR